jgi:hypothetical protein
MNRDPNGVLIITGGERKQAEREAEEAGLFYNVDSRYSITFSSVQSSIKPASIFSISMRFYLSLSPLIAMLSPMGPGNTSTLRGKPRYLASFTALRGIDE